MKKILISFLILAFFFPVFAFSAENELEKIPSPEQIPLFKIIKKEHGALYGIRLEKAEKPEKVENAEKVEGSATQSDNYRLKISEAISTDVKAEMKEKLEKIKGPWDLSSYEKIKKIGNALWGYRKEEKGLGTSELNATIITCLKTAIDKKDEAVKVTVNTSASELVKEISDRNTCQKAALDLSTNPERVKAFKICKENFEKAVKETRVNAKKAREAAWNVYRHDVKACHITNTATTTSTFKFSEEGNLLLEDGGNNLEL